MSLKMKCCSKCNVTLSRMSLKWNVTQSGMSLNGISLKIEYHSKWNVTQDGMSLRLDCHLNWNVTQT